MKKRDMKLLKKIVETPSPTGNETEVAELVRQQLGPVSTDIETDTMGSVHATYNGAANHGKPTSGKAYTLMLAAHMDEIGLMVTYISEGGFLSISNVGGVDAAILPGMRVDVHTSAGPLRGVVGRKPIHLIDPDERKNVTPIDSLVIDLGMPAKKVKKLVKVGDTITIAQGFERLGKNMAVSRAFDDKVGVYITCKVFKNLAENPEFQSRFVAAITVQEEIGTRGAITSAHSINPDVALAFDVTHATDYPGIDKSKYGDIQCGKGPVIARGPNINSIVYERLVKAAEELGINYQLEAEPSVTGTDARSIQVSRDGVPTGLVSIPLRYMHTPTEVIDLRDVEDTIKLITRFAIDIKDADNFIPKYVAKKFDKCDEIQPSVEVSEHAPE